MPTPFITIKENSTNEMIIKKSRFITQLIRVENLESAQEHLAEIKKNHLKANHSCWAVIINTIPVTERSSDDGEPSGTAGLPMLEVLRKKQLTNILAVTTRYFGGIKLGSGGLIRAYAGSISESLATTTLVIRELFFAQIVTISYSQHATVTNFLDQHLEFYLQDTQYLADVTLTIMVKENEQELFANELTNLLQGSVTIKKGPAQNFERDLPLDYFSK
ncbi:YigZ family protein [Enterococcus timonensis]|uniref:YigZ family protein n=1 Tax=Enterococcus timonensis TaxID=1852364 RepID=UPI0008DAE2BE|nr:YigZ family protein [Enterococcus timonensis]